MAVYVRSRTRPEVARTLGNAEGDENIAGVCILKLYEGGIRECTELLGFIARGAGATFCQGKTLSIQVLLHRVHILAAVMKR